jgi:ABC-type transport system substrate-binding protein
VNQRRSVILEPSNSRAALSLHRPVSRRTIVKAAMGSPVVLGLSAREATAAGSMMRLVQAEEQGTLHLPFYPYGQPLQFDPHRAPNWGPFWVLYPYLWAGLLRFDERGAVILELAESFEPNESADVWTATIRPGLTFASGEPVTAQSFIDSWLRALDPYQPAPMSTYMQLVEGYDAYVAGEGQLGGFRAVDDLTVEITLSQSMSSFPAYVATFGWSLVDVSAIDDEGDAGLQVPGLGPWMVSDLLDGQEFTLEPNPASPFGTSASVRSVVWHVYDGPAAMESALGDFMAGNLAIADVAASQVSTIDADESLSPLLVEIPDPSSVIALGMDFNQPPFDDLRYRRAVAASIDRSAWIEQLEQPAYVAAESMVPPAVQATADYTPATAIPFDPAGARSLLTEAGYEPEGSGPDVVFYQAGTDTEQTIAEVSALLTMIEEQSGLVIRHDTSLSPAQVAALQTDTGGRQIGLVWWWSDSDTPSLLQRIGQSSSPAMAGWFNWSPELVGVEEQDPGTTSAEFDEAIALANQAVDPDERNAAFRTAEQLLLDDAVYVPIGYWVQRFVQQPWLTGTRQGPWSGSLPIAIDEDVEILT